LPEKEEEKLEVLAENDMVESWLNITLEKVHRDKNKQLPSTFYKGKIRNVLGEYGMEKSQLLKDQVSLKDI
jgi:hypothetical protein